MKRSIVGSQKLLANNGKDSHKPILPKGLLKSASAMGSATLVSRVLGLVREQVFAYLFGAGNFTDAFNVAFRIPNLLRNLFAEGAMSSALVPVFAHVREQEGEERAWRVAGLVFRVLLFAVAIFAVIGIIFAPVFVSLYAPAFQQISGKFELTVRMVRIMFPFFPLVALAAAFMGVLNACGIFFVPAFSSALFNLVSVTVGVILATLVFKSGGFFAPIEGMAIGVVVGGLVQALFQLPSLYRSGYRWVSRKNGLYPSWREDRALRRMLSLMLPGIAGLGATQVGIFVNTMLATSQGAGAVSWLGYAFRLMQFPIGIFGVSLASAALPALSRAWIQGDVKAVRDTLLGTLDHVWAVNLPASVGLGVLGVPIIALLFQYGRFNEGDTQATARALAMYAVGLGAYSGVKVLASTCYAMGNTRIPVVSSGCSIALGIALNLAFVHPFGYWGLALATSISAVFNLVFLLFAVNGILKNQGAEVSFGAWFGPLLRRLSISLVMGTICWLSYRLLEARWPDSESFHFGAQIGFARGAVALLRVFKVGIAVTEGVAVVVLMDIFLKKLKKKLSPWTT